MSLESDKESEIELKTSLSLIIVASSDGQVIDRTAVVFEVEKIVPIDIFENDIYIGTITDDLLFNSSPITLPAELDSTITFAVEQCK